ncbi:restriction endonuclease subunit S [Staphylococcus cohnii]|nr:restriction endonuclease subunit S [Staphylococcus cohnii]WIL69777.1 restriction endonuclease subunit S [Staphylococcus cohnii]
MTNEMNVPELRFPGFEDEWKINLFGELVTNKSDKHLPKNNEQLIDIELDSIESNTGRLIHKYNSSHFSSQKHKFNKNQVLYSKLRPYLNKYYFTNFNGVCSSEIWVLNTKSDLKLINEFIYNFIQTNKFSQIANKSAGSKMPRADWNLVENIRFNIPMLKEQEKIGSFFSKLDRQIELEEQKLEKLEEQKKGYMQKIFSQQLRFKDENGNDYPEWKLCKLKDITISLKGQEKITKNLPILTISASKGWLKQEERFSQIIAGNSLKKYTHIKKGDLSYNKGNSKLAKYGIVYMLKEGEALVPNVYKSFRPKKYIASYFLEKYFHSQSVDRQLRTKISSTARMDGLLNISDKDFYEVNLKIPSYSEQDKIGSFFKKFDGFIGKQLNKVELLKERKKGFLQKMFV